MAALTLPGILDAFDVKPLTAARRPPPGAAAGFFSTAGRHGELDLLDLHLSDIVGDLARVVPLTAETAPAHALSLLAYLLTVQLDASLEAHYWAGDDITRCLGALVMAEPKDRALWVDDLPREAMTRAFTAASSACGSEFGASATLNNRDISHLFKALRRRVPDSVGLVFLAADLPHRDAVAMVRAVPDRIALGGFLALTPATAAVPPVGPGLQAAGFTRVGEVNGLLVVYQRVPKAAAKGNRAP